MPYVWGILSLIFWIIGFVMFLGLINPSWINKRLKENQKPFTRKKALVSWIIFSFLFIIFAGIAAPKSTTSAQGPLANAPVSTPMTSEAPKTVTTHTSSPKATIAPKATEDPAIKKAADNKAKVDAAKNITDSFDPKIKPDITSVSLSGGIGDSFKQIEKMLGKATRTNKEMIDGIGMYNYQDDLEVVMYIEGRVRSIAYQLDTKKKSMNEKDALEFVKRAMPADATFVKKIEKDNMERIYVYHSKSLEGLFSDEWFKDDNNKIHNGEFGIDLMHDGDQVDAFEVVIGGNI